MGDFLFTQQWKTTNFNILVATTPESLTDCQSVNQPVCLHPRSTQTNWLTVCVWLMAWSHLSPRLHDQMFTTAKPHPCVSPVCAGSQAVGFFYCLLFLKLLNNSFLNTNKILCNPQKFGGIEKKTNKQTNMYKWTGFLQQHKNNTNTKHYLNYKTELIHVKEFETYKFTRV